MALKVLWTQTSLNNLEEIFEYHKTKASVNIARKLVKRIVKATDRLQNSPEMGRREELLKNRKNEYRFLIEGNYKIIYWVEENHIKIATVFDTRQNPDKMKKL